MNIIYKRWSRAGYLPSWFYAILASGFVSLTIIAAVNSEWVAMLLATFMVGVTIAAARYMPRLAHASEASKRHYYPNDPDRGTP